MPKDTLTLGTGFELPLDAVTRTIALYGQKRQGKTSTAVVLIEEATKAGACFAWIDPTGAAWGLRSSADGESPGLDCVVMGGLHGDVPLDPGAGEVVARLVVVDGYNVVCDLKRMTLDEQVRFVGDFSDAAYHLCQRAVTIVYDEMRRFAPQKGGAGTDEAKKCLRAVSDVVMLGGHVGLGSVAIAQRMASLHKDVGEQADVVISHRLMGVNDRKSFGGWLEDAAEDPAAADAVLARLPRLKRGEAVVLAPEYDMLGVFGVRPKQTFDSSGTPDVGTVMLDAPQTRAAIDLADLEAKMGTALEAAQENDPEALKRRIRKLEAKLAEGGGASDEELAANYERAWKEGARDAIRNASPELEAIESLMADAADTTRSALDNGRRLIDKLLDRKDGAARDALREFVVEEGPVEMPDRTPEPAPAGSNGNGGGPSLKSGARRMVNVLARYETVRPEGLTRQELSTLAKVAKGGTLSDYLSALRTHGLIAEDGGTVRLSPAGRREAGDAGAAYTAQQVVDLHADKLKAGARRMLDVLMRMHPEGCTRAELSGLAQVAKGGTLSDYLSSLRSKGLIVERNRRVYAGDVLYLGRGA